MVFGVNLTLLCEFQLLPYEVFYFCMFLLILCVRSKIYGSNFLMFKPTGTENSVVI